MLFNTFQFALFLGLVVGLYRVLPAKARIPVLLVASLVFYTLWIPAYLSLLLIDIGVNFALLHWMSRSRHPRYVLALSIVFTLGLLAYFKYAAMMVSSLTPVLRWGLGWEPPIPDILLPLGISFYSFQIVAYNVDHYRRRDQPLPSLSRYVVFISFFPQLIAGPILRGSQFLPQLDDTNAINAERTRRGLWLLASGIAKKVIVADFLIAPFVDSVFSTPGVASMPFHWVAIWGFTFQIYFDFSGYTDMGRGIALCLGFELPFNFTEPYLARNPTEFWQRWHITLSQWLRDYLYIALGGNRRGALRTYVNLVLTMLLGGLWHGAGWNFVIWGGLQGVLLALHRHFGHRERVHDALTHGDIWKILLHFNVYSVVFVFFRTPTFSDAMTMMGGLAGGGPVEGWPVMECGILAFCALSHLGERLLRPRIGAVQAWCAATWAGLALEAVGLGALLALAIAVAGAGGEFIYFQF